MSSGVPVITIDGPSGSGKGTLSARIAQALGWRLLDSGALYRIVAWAALEGDVDLHDEDALEQLVRGLKIDFREVDGVYVPAVGGRTLDAEIRTEDVSRAASEVAALGKVRKALLALQHSMRRPPGLVADGRDMGSVVFPDAALKIYLTASPEARAERRYKQLKDKGLGGSLRGLLASIKERDKRDRTRDVSPLVPAPDAIVLDSTELTVENVVQHVLDLIHSKGLDRPRG